MFRPQILASFRLYKENLSVIHASVGGGGRVQGGGISARSRGGGRGGLGFGLVRNHIQPEH